MIKVNSRVSRAAILAVAVLGLTACDNMDEMQQRMVSGGAIGVVTGAAGAAVTGGCIACGMAIGGAVGTAGGYIVHELDQQTRSSPPPPPNYVPPPGNGYSPSSSNAPPSNNSYSSSDSSVPQGYPPGGYSTN